MLGLRDKMVLAHLKRGALNVEDAAIQLGIDHLGEVIESIEAAGHTIEFDGESYTMPWEG